MAFAWAGKTEYSRQRRKLCCHYDATKFSHDVLFTLSPDAERADANLIDFKVKIYIHSKVKIHIQY